MVNSTTDALLLARCLDGVSRHRGYRRHHVPRHRTQHLPLIRDHLVQRCKYVRLDLRLSDGSCRTCLCEREVAAARPVIVLTCLRCPEPQARLR